MATELGEDALGGSDAELSRNEKKRKNKTETAERLGMVKAVSELQRQTDRPVCIKRSLSPKGKQNDQY